MFASSIRIGAETIAEISKDNTSNKDLNKISLIKNTSNELIVTESLNNKSISIQIEAESIYLNMNKKNICQDMKKNNNIEDDYNDYIELDNHYELEIEQKSKIKSNKNKEKSSLPPINLDREKISLEKIKLELAEHLVCIFTESKLKVSKDNLLIILNKNPSLFLEKNINSQIFKYFMLQCINEISTLHYKDIKGNEILKDCIISYLFLYSYIFNKYSANNQDEFFIEDFSKVEKLNEFQKDKLYVDIIEVLCDNIIDKDEIICFLSTILERSELMKYLNFLRGLIRSGKGENIQEKESKYNSIKNTIERSIKKINKENIFNKIELSDESMFKILQEILKSKEVDSKKFCEQLSEIIVDKSQLKKNIFNFLSDRLNDIPIELFVINENRKFTKCIIEYLIYSLEINNMIKKHDKVDLYNKIDYQLQSIYQDIDL